MSLDMRSLKIYIDGSCAKNPGGSGGFAAWLEFPFDWGRPDEHLESRGYFHTTNNRMELRACLFAHEWILEERDELRVSHVQIVSDSKYVHENYNRCLSWYQNDWLSVHEREILNVDLWKDLIRVRRKLRGRPRVDLVRVPRRSSEITKNVDRDAKFASRAPTYVDSGFQPGKIGRARNSSKRAATPYPAASDEVIIYIYRTQVAQRGVQTIRFQTYSEERKDFFEKFWALADDAIGNLLHRGNAFLVRMNDVPENPRIIEIVEALKMKNLIGLSNSRFGA